MKLRAHASHKIGIAAVLLMFLVLSIAFIGMPDSLSSIDDEPVASQGVLDLTDWDWENDGIVNLKGEWAFYWGQLLDTQSFRTEGQRGGRLWVQVPNVWTNYEMNDEPLPGMGYATYRLMIRLGETAPSLGLKIPDLSTSCKIMIDGKTIATCGQVADNAEQAEARYAPQVVTFQPEAEEFELIVQVSNYLYDRGGMWYALDLGTERQVMGLRENELAISLILLGVFFFMGLYHLAIYILRQREKIALYFAIGSLIGALRLLAAGEIYLLNLFPGASVEVITAIIYFTYYGGVTVFTLYLRELYPDEISLRITRGVAGISALFIVSILVLPLDWYTHLIRYYHLFFMALGCYLIYSVFLAVWRKRAGSGLQFFGIAFFVLSIFHDIFFNLFYISELVNDANTIQFLKRQIVSLGLFVLVFVQAIILAQRFSKAFQSVENLSERLLSLDRLKDEFLINTSHELKTPLHGIMNISQSMIEGSSGPINERQKRNLSVMVSVSRRLTNLIQDIMDFAKLRNNEIQLNKRPISLEAIIQANMEVFLHYVGDKPITIQLQLPANLPAVHADENRVLQVLYNLIGNAIKFTDAGSIVISAEHQGDWVEVRVKDTGIGIPNDKQQLIFHSFEQVGAAVSREYGGSGLGLSISKQLVTLSGGSMQVHSVPGEGSTFTFTLPVSKEQEERAARSDNASGARFSSGVWEAGTEEAASGKEVAAYTILAVDDDPANLQVIMNVFAKEPYRIMAAHDGTEALDLLMGQAPLKIDMVILDVMMPKLSGYEVTRTIRERYSLSELPILLVTVKNEPEDLQSGFAAGANDFLVKPFYPHELRARTRTLLTLKQSVGEVVQAELSFLRAQIKPHFLYNALNTIIGICPRDPKQASLLLSELSYFLRGSFDFHNKERLVSIHKELELVSAYVAIETARFGERLHVVYEVEEDIQLYIPPLSIQPLVENGIRHGVMKQVDGGTIQLSVWQDSDSVHIQVVDNGVGIPADKLATLLSAQSDGRGVGLQNIHQRLLRMYGTGLSIESDIGSGTKVKLRIPKDIDMHEQTEEEDA